MATIKERWEEFERQQQISVTPESIKGYKPNLPLPRPESPEVDDSEVAAIAYLIWEEGVTRVDDLLFRCYGVKKGRVTHEYDLKILGTLAQRVGRIKKRVQQIYRAVSFDKAKNSLKALQNQKAEVRQSAEPIEFVEEKIRELELLADIWIEDERSQAIAKTKTLELLIILRDGIAQTLKKQEVHHVFDQGNS